MLIFSRQAGCASRTNASIAPSKALPLRVQPRTAHKEEKEEEEEEEKEEEKEEESKRRWNTETEATTQMSHLSSA